MMRTREPGMAFAALPPLLLVLLLLSFFRPPGAAAYEAYWCNGTLGNFTAGSAFAANLDRLAASLPATASSSPSLFATTTLHGADDNASTVHGLALCRGDVTDPSACSSCLRAAFPRLRQLCGGARDATLYAELCTARYSGDDFLSRPGDNAPVVNAMSATNASTYPGWDPRNATARSFFLSLVGTLFGEMAMYASYNTSASPRRYFASAVMFINADLPTVYGLAQCTPDLAPSQCWHCLQGIGQLNQQWYDGREGGRILGARCSFRYEGYQFFHGTPGVRIGLPHTDAGAGGSSGHRTALIVGLTVSITAVFCAVLCFLLRFYRLHRRKAKAAALHSQSRRSSCSKATEEALKLWRIEERGSEFTLFEFPELAAATGGFAEANRLGRGGFGPVYRGRLPGGAEVAVKRLAAQSGLGLEEFKNEIQLIAQLQHTNLVRLLGCCVHAEEKLLVYEYMPHRSLDGFIFDRQRGAGLDWPKRLRVVEGVAQGLLYLHKHSRVRIIHRDLKASNILLDKDLNPKISDFGMARIFGSNITEANTNRVVGTYGYMAPEYASEGIFSAKSDVYSFGVLLLEIVSGKRNSGHHHQHYGDFVNLLGYAWQLWKDGRALELVDPTLGGGGGDVTASVMRCIKVALLCVQDSATDRPTMADVTAMLAGSGDAASLPDPRRPPHFRLRVSTSDDDGWSEAGTRSSHGTTSCSANGLTITTIQEGR